ncbi:MAG TPA: signal peptidase II [Candidatus Dorea gallistercoris]|uniref:Lipoprotein signal peptidase n=1 Tax=Candidatus Dorea gallistercoris TaxID=2838542 RepID=A0A9D1UDX5_9FIRM|nr:signal peptidase II [Candidatus Dorea gallistercoris]
MREKRSLHYLVALIGVLAGVCLDQATKFWAILTLKDQPPLILIDGVFQLEYLENRGAAFGLLQGQRLFFFLSAAVICALVVWFYLRVPMERRYVPLRILAILIVAGALGNFIDRLRLGYVVDFFYFKLIDFPIFNVADIYVTISTFALLFLLFFYYKEEDLDRIFRGRSGQRTAD